MSKKWPQKWVKNSQKWPIFGQKRVDFFWKSFWPVFDSKFPKIVQNRTVRGTPKMTIFEKKWSKNTLFCKTGLGRALHGFWTKMGQKVNKKWTTFFQDPEKHVFSQHVSFIRITFLGVPVFPKKWSFFWSRIQPKPRGNPKFASKF